MTRPPSHRNSPAKIKENYGITSKSAPSPNSSASDNLSSEKCPASSCTSGKLRKALFEMPKEVATGTADSYRNGNLLGTPCAQFFHGAPAFHSSMVSATLTGSSSSFLTHTSCEQFAPTTGARTSADSTVSQCGKKNQEMGNAMAVHLPRKDDSINIAGNSMIFSAKNPSGNSGNALPVTFAAKPPGLRMPTKDDTIGINSNSMIFSAKGPPSKTSNALPVTFAAKPSGLRMPSPKLGFFDSTKVIRAPFSSSLHRKSAGNRVLPKPIPRGPSNINQGNRLKPPAVPCAVPSSVSVSNFSFPNYNAILPSSTPVTSNSMSDTALKSSITSIPAPPFLAQVKSDPEASGLVLLAQRKFGAFKTQQSSSVQRSDQKQVHSDNCNAANTVVAEDIERKTNLQSNICQVSQYNYATMADGNHTQLRFSQVGSSLQGIPRGGSEAISVSTISTEASLDTEPGKISNVSVVSDILVNRHIPKGRSGIMAEESKTQLGFLQEKSFSPDIPHVGSEAIIATETDTETSQATEAGKISTMNVVSEIQTNPHIPKGNYGKMAEESQTRLSFMQGKSTSQDICQTGPQPIWKDRNGANTSPTTEIGKALNANNDNIPQPGHCHGMAVLSDAKTNHMSEPLQSKQLPPLPCSKTAKVSEKFQLETCPDLIQDEEQDGLSNGDSKGTMRDDKVKNGVSDLGSSLQQENKMKLASCPVTLEHLPSPRQNLDLCSSLQESEMEPGSGHLPSPGQNVSVHIEKQDGNSHQVSQTSISIQDADLHDNIRNGNPNLVCQLQLENEIEPASQLVLFEQSLPTREGETEKVTEELLFSEASSLEKGLDLGQHKVRDRACTKVCQGSMNIQSGYSCDKVQSILSDVTASLESKTGMKFNPEKHDCPVNALSSSNNNQDSTSDTLIIPSLLSGCPSREAAPSVLEHISEDKDDSSLRNVKLSDSSATLEAKMKSELKCAGKEVKVNGRSPLSPNYRLLNSTAQEISQKHVKGRRCSMAGPEKLTSLPMSFSVLDDIAEKENNSPEGQDGVGMLEAQGADGHSHVSSGRKSKDNLTVQVQKNTNRLDASPFSEEWIAAIQAVGEEWLQMKRGPVQNSPPNKIVPQPGPWSPVRRHNQQLGPFDCTKYTNAPESSDVCEGE